MRGEGYVREEPRLPPHGGKEFERTNPGGKGRDAVLEVMLHQAIQNLFGCVNELEFLFLGTMGTYCKIFQMLS